MFVSKMDIIIEKKCKWGHQDNCRLLRSKNNFLNGLKKLIFVRMYGSTIIGVVGPPYPYCSKSFRKKNKEFKTALITSFTLLRQACISTKNICIWKR